MPNGKIIIIYLTAWLIKNIFLHKISYFTPFGHSKNKTKVKIDLYNYAAKSDLSVSVTGVGTSQFA